MKTIEKQIAVLTADCKLQSEIISAYQERIAQLQGQLATAQLEIKRLKQPAQE